MNMETQPPETLSANTVSSEVPHGPLATLEHLGDATGFVERIFGMIEKIQLFEGFERPEIRLLCHFMQVYQAQPGQAIIHEGDAGDHMLLIVEGSVEILKNDLNGVRKRIGIVDTGKTLGEMSMIDGEPRFASCIAVTTTTVAVLDRDNLSRIIYEQPRLGAKILMELVLMLSQRLRQTSAQLVNQKDA